MALITVEISDLRVSADQDSTLVTYALGSCIAVMVHDPLRKVAGMIHYMLPLSETSAQKAAERPAMFADTGIPLLFKTMYGYGCEKKDLVVKVAGGGALYDDQGLFSIGKRNYTVLRKLFWKNGIIIAAEDVGGARSRTVRLEVLSGRCTVQSQGEELAL
ncbi:chemotaxis protein CheD [Anaeromyxobacter paludicola]|uniref:Probable chemoreceptor glutamine deamidase CheD n=1 Tax=Anaeromyxobacter paludicola TaxID=2918171 RepID=A0ABM7X810_9BACT|nr:chemotaxis protein CheD [Anaeromyxobacter paludicola]BDG07981.1 chemoreceptor glutamine deamidase CheD [Anaeromyxobacter paludicola]